MSIREELIHDKPVPEKLAISQLVENPELVHELLLEHEESYNKTNTLTLRKLGPGLKITIWFLRVYVLFMIVVAVIQIINTLH